MKKTIVEKMADKVRKCCFVSVLVVGSLNLWADHVVVYQVGDLVYKYDRDAPGQGAMVVRAYMSSKNLVIPAKEHLPLGSVCECGAVHLETDPGKFVDIPVVEVGAEVFWREDLHEIHILGALKRIGYRAFSQNKNLIRVIVSGAVDEVGEEAFNQCSSLKQIEFPNDGPRIIGSHAFSGSGLEMFDFGARVESVGDNAFSGTELTAVTVRADIRWGAGVFAATPMKNVTFEGDFTEIAEEMFSHCHELEKIAWPPTLKHIGDLAFAHCDNLTTVDFSATSLETIGQAAFASCGKIQDPMIFPETLKQLGPCAFYPAGPWVENYGDMAKQPPVVRFLGPPPEMDEYVFNSGSVYFLYGKYADAYREEWEEAIATYGDINETQGEWHGLNMLPLLVRPIGYQCLKDGTQELNVGWSVFEEGDDLDKRNWRELGNKRFYVWRSSGNDYTDARHVKLLTEEPISGTNYIDKTFGEINGTQPVRYWVELESTAGRRPTERAVFCDTRRRFGLAIGLSEYDPSIFTSGDTGEMCFPPSNWLPSCVNDANAFAAMLTAQGGTVRTLINSQATMGDVSSSIKKLPFEENGKKRFVPGDIAFLWISTHGVTQGGITAYDGYYLSGTRTFPEEKKPQSTTFQNDLAWVREFPGVRFVGLLPICHAKHLANPFSNLPNVAWICAAKENEEAADWWRSSQFSTYFLNHGVKKGIADQIVLEGDFLQPDDEYGVCLTIGNANGYLDLGEMARYGRALSYGFSSMRAAHAAIVNERVLNSISMSSDRIASVSGKAPEKPEAVAREDEDTGAIRLYVKENVAGTDLLIGYREVGTELWQWSSARVFGNDRGEDPDIFWVGKDDWLTYFTRYYIFGSQSKNERENRGIIKADTEYEFVVQSVNEYGYGPIYKVKKSCKTGASLPTVPKEVYDQELRSLIKYAGVLTYSDHACGIMVEAQSSGASVGVSATIRTETGDVCYYGEAGTADINSDGEIQVLCVKTHTSAFAASKQLNSTLAGNLPSQIELRLSIDCVCSGSDGYSIMCTPVGEFEWDEDDDGRAISVDDEYGPFVPGEKVELKFSDGAAWKVTGLPTGLKWDAKLPGVTGVPTKPGTNTVTFTWTDKSVTPNVTHKASSTFIVGPLPVLSVQTAGEGTGKVSGAGAYAANKKVTLKATADTKDAAAKGKNPATVKSVFAGWYDASGGLVAQTPSLSYVMPPHDVALEARFIPASNDWATADCVMEAGSVWVVSNETKVAITPISVVAAGGSLPTVKVAGLPSGLKFTAKDIMKKNPKTEVDVPANTIYGTPTKGGVYNATVTVTTAGKASVVRAIKFIIRTARDYVVDADWDPVQGKVTGVGVYQPGKKVTLKATANKGYVFAGWYEGGHAGRVTLPGTEPLSLAASYVFTMPTNDNEMVAAFVTAEEDATNIVASVNGMAFGAGSGGEGADVTKMATNVMAGVYLAWPVAASALSETTVKVAGLPSGLKFSAKPITSKVTSGTGASRVTTVVTNVAANTIYGAPSAASKTAKDKTTGLMTVKPSVVKVTVTTAGKNAQTYQIDATVDPLPAWAVGTFAGPSYGAAAEDGGSTEAYATNGQATVTIAASGKITAKQPVDGKSTSFAANYFDVYDGDSFWATLTAKVGKEIVTNEMVVSGHAGRVTLPGGGEQIVTNGVIEADLFDAWQYNWKDDSWKAIGKAFDKREYVYVVKADGSFSTSDEDVASPLGTEAFGKVTLKFSANGTAKVAGEFAKLDDEGAPVYRNGKLQTVKASGSATLLPTAGEDGETRYLVFVYLAPKGLPPHARCLEI